MWDFFFLFVSKHVFPYSGKICLALIKGHAFNKLFNYGFFFFFLVVQLTNYFIILEALHRGGVTEMYSYPLHGLYALARIFLIQQSRNMRSSEVKGRSEHRKSCERDQKKSQSLLLQTTGGRTCWSVYLFKMPPLPFARILFVFSTGTSWLCKKHYFLQTWSIIYP